MFSLIKQWFYISTKCQADLWPFIQGHSFCICIDSAFMDWSTPTTAFDSAIGYFAYTM